MTKEERPIIGILKKYSSEVNNWNDAVFSDKFEVVENDIINVMQEYADQQTKDKDKEIEELKERNINQFRMLDDWSKQTKDAHKEITQLKQQLKEKSEEVEKLKEKKVCHHVKGRFVSYRKYIICLDCNEIINY